MSDLSYGDARREVAALGRELFDRELVRATGGNVSVRAGDGIAVSPSGVPYGEVSPEDVPVVDLDGERLTDGRAASSETPMHRRIYRERPEVGGIVHTHSPFASTFAALGEPVPASHYLVAYVGREIPVADWADPGSEALADEAVAAMGDEADACLLKHHGVVAVGGDGPSALENAEMVEFCAGVHQRASAIGDPAVLPDGEVDDLVDMFEGYRDRGDD